jgi:hypothetical protein
MLNNGRRVTLLFFLNLFPALANIDIFHHYSYLFLSRSNKMATDIGFLAAGHDEHVIRLGIGHKGCRKRCSYFFHCKFPSHCIFKEHHSLAHLL